MYFTVKAQSGSSLLSLFSYQSGRQILNSFFVVCSGFSYILRLQEGHLFKWVEDGMYEEVKDLLSKFQRRESEIENGMIEVNELKIEIHNLKEEVFGCKNELRQWKMKILVLFIFVCVLAFVITYLMLASQGTNLLLDH